MTQQTVYALACDWTSSKLQFSRSALVWLACSGAAAERDLALPHRSLQKYNLAGGPLIGR